MPCQRASDRQDTRVVRMRRRANEMDPPGLLQFDDEQRGVRDEGAEGPAFVVKVGGYADAPSKCDCGRLRDPAKRSARHHGGDVHAWPNVCSSNAPDSDQFASVSPEVILAVEPAIAQKVSPHALAFFDVPLR
jgi:hypothetical protein